MLCSGSKASNFLLHYSFPQFSNNELGKAGPLSRREVGHGALAEKALRPLIPPDLPMTVLLAATVLESNGRWSLLSSIYGSTVGRAPTLTVVECRSVVHEVETRHSPW